MKKEVFEKLFKEAVEDFERFSTKTRIYYKEKRLIWNDVSRILLVLHKNIKEDDNKKKVKMNINNVLFTAILLESRLKIKDFLETMAERITETKRRLSSKSGEYSHNDDRFYNFRYAAEKYNKPLELVIFDYMKKHEASIHVMLQTFDNKYYNEDYINEKLGDLVGYLFLLKVYFYDKI